MKYMLFMLAGLLLVNIAAVAEDVRVSGATLVYVEEGKDELPVTTTMFVNKDYMHIRDSISPNDFILFDRNSRTIHVVTTSEQTIFVIHSKPVNITPPIKLEMKETTADSSDFPMIDGRKIRHFQYWANGELCYEAAVLPDDFLTEASQAMYEFKQVMAGEHATSLNQIPESMLTACEISLNVFHAGEYFKRGLPVREWKPDGYQRYLKTYEVNSTLPESDFVLPESYERFSIGDLLNENTK